MNDPRSELQNPSRRLPNLELPAVDDGASMRIRPGGRHAPVLVLLHGAGCAQCSAYIRELAEHHSEIAESDGRVIAVMPDSADDAPAANLELPFPVLVDSGHQLASALDVQAPAVVTADQWGGIHSVEPAGAAHDFPPTASLLESLRYLSMQCPECEGEAF